MKPTTELRIAASKRDQKGLDVRELPAAPGMGEVFSLDIPFYRTRFVQGFKTGWNFVQK